MAINATTIYVLTPKGVIVMAAGAAAVQGAAGAKLDPTTVYHNDRKAAAFGAAIGVGATGAQLKAAMAAAADPAWANYAVRMGYVVPKAQPAMPKPVTK